MLLDLASSSTKVIIKKKTQMTGDTSRQTAVLSLVMENVDGMQSERMKKKRGRKV